MPPIPHLPATDPGTPQTSPRAVHRVSPPLQHAAPGTKQLVRVKYTHDAMIDHIIANPRVTSAELAELFQYSQAWVGKVLNSESFQARLAQRRSDVVDPTLALTVEERLKAMANRSLDLVLEKLEATGPGPSFSDAMRAVEISTKALGYGARQQTVAVQTSFVVAMPEKVTSAEDWAAKALHERRGAGASPIDVEVRDVE